MKAAFIEWYWTRPRAGSQSEFADEHGVSPVTLSVWKKSPEFRAKDAEYKRLLLPDFIEATSKMLQLAIGGNVNAYRAVSDVLGQKFMKIEHGGRIDGEFVVQPVEWPEYESGGKIVPFRRSA